MHKFITETGGKCIGHIGIVICSIILTLSIFVLSKVFTEWNIVEETFHSIQLKKDLAISPSGADMFKHSKYFSQ